MPSVTLFVAQQEGNPDCKNLSGEVLVWLSVWIQVQMIAYGPADATATPSSLTPVKSNVLPFWCQLTQVVLEKRPLNGCSSSS